MIAISVNNRSLFIILVLGYIIHMSFGIAKAYKKDGKTNIELRNELKKVILLIYVWILISTTLLPILIPPVGAPCIDFNFNVGEMFRFEDNDILIRNVFGNIMLLMPLGFCIVVCLDKRLSSKKIFFLSALISLGIETMQFIENMLGFVDVTYRLPDINDFILNVFGAMLGWWLLKCYEKFKE